MKRLRVGVVYGGRSSEHEVSVASAAAVFANLDPTRYDALPIYIERDGRWSLPTAAPTVALAAEVIEVARAPRSGDRSPQTGQDVHLVAHPSAVTLVTIQRDAEPPQGTALVGGLTLDVVFPVVHGPYGEDGTLQGMLEIANVPYVGAGVLSSAVAMDKTVAKALFASRGLPVVAAEVVTAADWEHSPDATIRHLVERLSFPLFVKPANLGSSVGISKATDAGTLAQAIDFAQQFDHKVLVEVAVRQARELECAVLGNDEPVVSVPGEIVPAGEFYDYGAKYLKDQSELIIPAKIADAEKARVQAMAITAFRAIEGAGMARVDFLMNGETTELFLNEVNTIPGFTTISMYAKLWDASGLRYPALLDKLIELALERYARKQTLRTSALP